MLISSYHAKKITDAVSLYVFIIRFLASLLLSLIYNDEYELIESHLADRNVVARKGQHIRDNISVLNATMNDAVNRTKEALDIVINEVEKYFDSLWLKKWINDIYDVALKTKMLNLLYVMNETAQMA